MKASPVGALFRYEGDNYLKIAGAKWAIIRDMGMFKVADIYNDFWSGEDAPESVQIHTINRAPHGYRLALNSDGSHSWDRATRQHEEGNLVNTTLADAVAFLLGEKQPLHVNGQSVVLVKD